MICKSTVPLRLCLLLLLVGTSAAWAQKKAPPAREEKAERKDQSALPESVRRVERQTGGEVLRAEPMQRDGREVYRLKVLTADGRVRVLQDDPNERKPRPEGLAPRNKDKEQEKKPSRDSDEQPQF